MFCFASWKCQFARSPFLWAAWLALLATSPARPVLGADGTVILSITDEAGEPMPCRIHLADQRGQPQRADGLPFFRDHFACPGRVELKLPAGRYDYKIERGPEYGRLSGSFSSPGDDQVHVSLRLKPLVDLGARGWFSGDLHVHRALEDMPLLMAAEDLDVAPVITWWNNRNLWSQRPLPEDPLVRLDGPRFFHRMAGEDEREGGALMFFNLRRPLAIAGASREYPSPMKFLAEARQHENVWVDIEKPFWWDVPVWLASGLVDSVGLANNHMCRSTMYATEAWGRPRDAQRLPPPRGNGFWTQEIYYQMLDCGLRIPPSAGSASGVLPNPLGYDRVYVHVGRELGYDRWWEGLRAGRVFVTNGPLLLVQADGHWPGHVFTAPAGEALTIELEAELVALDRVPAVEIIKNGGVERTVPWDNAASPLALGSITFRQSGWFLVRAITDVPHTFRFASTGPFYVEVGTPKRRISRQSVQFFLDWVRQRIERVPDKLKDPAKLRAVLEYHEQARTFWQEKLEEANAE